MRPRTKILMFEIFHRPDRLHSIDIQQLDPAGPADSFMSSLSLSQNVALVSQVILRIQELYWRRLSAFPRDGIVTVQDEDCSKLS